VVFQNEKWNGNGATKVNLSQLDQFAVCPKFCFNNKEEDDYLQINLFDTAEEDDDDEVEDDCSSPATAKTAIAGSKKESGKDDNDNDNDNDNATVDGTNDSEKEEGHDDDSNNGHVNGDEKNVIDDWFEYGDDDDDTDDDTDDGYFSGDETYNDTNDNDNNDYSNIMYESTWIIANDNNAAALNQICTLSNGWNLKTFICVLNFRGDCFLISKHAIKKIATNITKDWHNHYLCDKKKEKPFPILSSKYISKLLGICLPQSIKYNINKPNCSSDINNERLTLESNDWNVGKNTIT
jgi:hypothetical protein